MSKIALARRNPRKPDLDEYWPFGARSIACVALLRRTRNFRRSIEDGCQRLSALQAWINGVSNADVASRVAAVTKGYQAEANEYLHTLGVTDPAAFKEWAEANHREEFVGAVSGHMSGTMDGYDSLAASFKGLAHSVSEPGALADFNGFHSVEGYPDDDPAD